MSKNISNLIKKFDKLKRLIGNPKYTERDVAEFEKNVNCKLPPDYRATLLAGYIDKGTFHFLIPKRHEGDKKFVIFGKWHDDIFMFDTSADTEDYPVYVIVGDNDKKPEKRFNNFYSWLESVLSSVSSTNFPG